MHIAQLSFLSMLPHSVRWLARKTAGIADSFLYQVSFLLYHLSLSSQIINYLTPMRPDAPARNNGCSLSYYNAKQSEYMVILKPELD